MHQTIGISNLIMPFMTISQFIWVHLLLILTFKYILLLHLHFHLNRPLHALHLFFSASLHIILQPVFSYIVMYIMLVSCCKCASQLLWQLLIISVCVLAVCLLREQPWSRPSSVKLLSWRSWLPLQPTRRCLGITVKSAARKARGAFTLERNQTASFCKLLKVISRFSLLRLLTKLHTF